MASPQKENGYTPIANEILEQIAKQPLNGTQFRIAMVIWRYTYGFSRKGHDLSEGFIATATNIHKKQVQRELNTLISYNIVTILKEATFSSSRVLQFNKNYDSWVVTKMLPPNESDTHTGNELDTSPGSGLVTQENNKTNTKESITSKHKKDRVSKVFDTKSIPFRLAIKLKEFIFNNNPECKEPNLQSWALEFDRMIRIDKRDSLKIYEIMEFSQKDTFWKTNILSAKSLRDKYDKLKLKKETEKCKEINPAVPRQIIKAPEGWEHDYRYKDSTTIDNSRKECIR